MSDNEKMFVYTKRGWNLQIAPRNARGVLAFVLWMLPLAPILTAYVLLVDGADTLMLVGATVLLLAATVIWIVLMVRWMKPRSEVIDVDALMEIKAGEERKKRGRK